MAEKGWISLKLTEEELLFEGLLAEVLLGYVFEGYVVALLPDL